MDLNALDVPLGGNLVATAMPWGTRVTGVWPGSDLRIARRDLAAFVQEIPQDTTTRDLFTGRIASAAETVARLVATPTVANTFVARHTVHEGVVWARLFGRACAAFPEMPTPAEVSGHLRGSGMGIEHFKYQIAPAVVGDPRGFLSTMAVIAPVWLEQAPDGDTARVLSATLAAIESGSPNGFVCTQAGVEVVARKGAAVPMPPGRGPTAPPQPPAPTR